MSVPGPGLGPGLGPRPGPRPNLPEATKQISGRVPATLSRRFKIQAIREGLTIRELLTKAVALYLEAMEDVFVPPDGRGPK